MPSKTVITLILLLQASAFCEGIHAVLFPIYIAVFCFNHLQSVENIRVCLCLFEYKSVFVLAIIYMLFVVW